MEAKYWVVVALVIGLLVGAGIGYVTKPPPPPPPEIAELEAKVSELEGTIAGLEAKTSELKGTIAERDARIAELEAKIVPRQFEGIKIVWIGGASGDPFDTLLAKGAMDAAKYFGVTIEYMHTEWRPDLQVERFRDAIALEPDGIVVMGHPGYEAYAELFEEAHRKGILVTLANVDIRELREKYPYCGYVGQDLYAAGYILGKRCAEKFGLGPGDRAAIPSGSWPEPARALRAIGVEDALKEAGVTVDRVMHAPEVYGDPSLGIPVITGYYAAHPDVDLIVFDGGGTTAATSTFIEALGVSPGEIKVAGFDLSPATIDAIKAGYLQMTIDQQPYLQGYLTVLNLCLHKKWGFAGLYIDTGGGIVDSTNVAEVEALVEAGYR
jgi:simple sugar transport system substrate-binding protein